VIGAIYDGDNGDYSGSAYVFTKPTSGCTVASQYVKLKAWDGAESDYFGYSVSISGDHIVIGAYGDDDNGNYSGSAYVFTKPTSGWINSTQNG